MRTFILLFINAWIFGIVGSAFAGQLQLSPVSIEVAAPAATSTLNITNSGKTRMTIQARLFGWKQKNNKDSYFRTRDVVVSPPVLKLKPGQSGIIRVVRTSKAPIQGEESYRLIVDELPKQGKKQRSTVQMVVRYSIPVFFSATGAAASTSWKAVQRNGKFLLQGRNSGPTRLKLSKLTLTDAKGRKLSFGSGLNGYILGNSSRNFVVETSKKLSGGSLKLTALSNFGKIRKSVKFTK